MIQSLYFSITNATGGGFKCGFKIYVGCSNHLRKILKEHKVIVNKSTVSVGNADKVSAAIEKNCSVEYDCKSSA